MATALKRALQVYEVASLLPADRELDSGPSKYVAVLLDRGTFAVVTVKDADSTFRHRILASLEHEPTVEEVRALALQCSFPTATRLIREAIFALPNWGAPSWRHAVSVEVNDKLPASITSGVSRRLEISVQSVWLETVLATGGACAGPHLVLSATPYGSIQSATAPAVVYKVFLACRNRSGLLGTRHSFATAVSGSWEELPEAQHAAIEPTGMEPGVLADLLEHQGCPDTQTSHLRRLDPLTRSFSSSS